MFRIPGSKCITSEEYTALIAFGGSTFPTTGSVFVLLTTNPLFNNPALDSKIRGNGLWFIAPSDLVFELARWDNKTNSIDVDRYNFSEISGGDIIIVGPIKNFPEHHRDSILPPWYFKEKRMIKVNTIDDVKDCIESILPVTLKDTGFTGGGYCYYFEAIGGNVLDENKTRTIIKDLCTEKNIFVFNCGRGELRNFDGKSFVVKIRLDA